jgi:hypothetical protein
MTGTWHETVNHFVRRLRVTVRAAFQGGCVVIDRRPPPRRRTDPGTPAQGLLSTIGWPASRQPTIPSRKYFTPV